MKTSALALGALLSALTTVPAIAAPNSVAVRSADLNLANSAGRETLARRISAAAKQLCIVTGDRSLVAMVEGNKCYDRAVSSAQHQTMSNAGGAPSVSQ